MDSYAKGCMLAVAALGMFTTMAAVDIAQLPDWEPVLQPAFVGKLLGYFGTVCTAFVAGKLIPTSGERS